MIIIKMKTKILTQSPGRGQQMYHQRFLVCRVDINSNGNETTHFQTCKMKNFDIKWIYCCWHVTNVTDCLFPKGQVWFGPYWAPIFFYIRICLSLHVFTVKCNIRHLTVHCNQNFLHWWGFSYFSGPLNLPYWADFWQFRPFSARKWASKYLGAPMCTADF